MTIKASPEIHMTTSRRVHRCFRRKSGSFIPTPSYHLELTDVRQVARQSRLAIQELSVTDFSRALTYVGRKTFRKRS